jgi:hypothetical protein
MPDSVPSARFKSTAFLAASFELKGCKPLPRLTIPWHGLPARVGIALAGAAEDERVYDPVRE